LYEAQQLIFLSKTHIYNVFNGFFTEYITVKLRGTPWSSIRITE